MAEKELQCSRHEQISNKYMLAHTDTEKGLKRPKRLDANVLLSLLYCNNRSTNDTEKYIADNEAVQSTIKLLTNKSPTGNTCTLYRKDTH